MPQAVLVIWKCKRETFSQALFRIIREKELSEVETYKAAQIDRKLFSKIRSNDNYVPGRKTAIAFTLALQLDLEESLLFLKTAGITLSHSSKFDLIIEYFIKNEIYDIYEVNKALYDFDQDLLSRR